MKGLLMCICAVFITIPLAFVILGPIARQQGAEQANRIIEASACGDDTGEVSKGWEERCADRADHRSQ